MSVFSCFVALMAFFVFSPDDKRREDLNTATGRHGSKTALMAACLPVAGRLRKVPDNSADVMGGFELEQPPEKFGGFLFLTPRMDSPSFALSYWLARTAL